MLPTLPLDQLLDHLTTSYYSEHVTASSGSPGPMDATREIEECYERAADQLVTLGQILLRDGGLPDDFVERLFGDQTLSGVRVANSTMRELFGRHLPSRSGYARTIYSVLMEHFGEDDIEQTYVSQLGANPTQSVLTKVRRFIDIARTLAGEAGPVPDKYEPPPALATANARSNHDERDSSASESKGDDGPNRRSNLGPKGTYNLYEPKYNGAKGEFEKYYDAIKECIKERQMNEWEKWNLIERTMDPTTMERANVYKRLELSFDETMKLVQQEVDLNLDGPYGRK